VEVLAAVMVLSLILVAFSEMFANSIKAMDVGTGNLSMNARGRGLLDQICKDLEMAMVDDTREMTNSSGVLALGSNVDYELYFTAWNGNAKTSERSRRGISEVWYYLMDNYDGENTASDVLGHGYDRKALCRQSFQTLGTVKAYSTGWQAATPSNAEVICDNVHDFSVRLYNAAQSIGAGIAAEQVGGSFGNIPEYAVVTLELLDEDTARLVDMLTPANATALIARNKHVYTRRVDLKTSRGYNKP